MELQRTFFVTTATYQRQPLFRSDEIGRIFLNMLFEYRDQSRYLLHEFVIMPDHLHAIVTPNGLLSLERAMQFIKGGFSHRIAKDLNRKIEVWQRSFTNHRISNQQDYLKHQQY